MNIVRAVAVTSLFAVAQLSAAGLPVQQQKPAVKATPAPAVKPNPFSALRPVLKPAVPVVKPTIVKSTLPAVKQGIPAAKPTTPAAKPTTPVVKPAPAVKTKPVVKPVAKPVVKKPTVKASRPDPKRYVQAHGRKKAEHHGKDAVKGKQLHWGSSSSSSSSSSFFASSSSSDEAYDGAYTQNLSLNGEFNPYELESVLVPIEYSDPAAAAITFNSNEPGSPKNVAHPAGSDYTRFRIEKSGVYLINWTFTVGCLGYEGEGQCFNGFFVQLYDAAHNVALNPNPFQFVDTENFYQLIDSEVVAGQQLIQLNKGVELQLRVIPLGFNCGSLWIANPSFTLARVN